MCVFRPWALYMVVWGEDPDSGDLPLANAEGTSGLWKVVIETGYPSHDTTINLYDLAGLPEFCIHLYTTQHWWNPWSGITGVPFVFVCMVQIHKIGGGQSFCGVVIWLVVIHLKHTFRQCARCVVPSSYCKFMHSWTSYSKNMDNWYSTCMQ